MGKQTKIIDFKKSLPSFIKLKEETYINKQLPAVFVDEIYGEFVSLPRNISIGHIHHKRAIALGKNVKKTPEEVEMQLPAYIRLKKESYVNNGTKCIFIDKEHGEFTSTPNLVISKGVQHPKRSLSNRQNTCLMKYGVTHVSKSPEILHKMRKNMRRTTVVKHWKTGEELLATGSYELNALNWLNANQIEFDWQIPFILENKSVYFCDCFLITQNLYVEIKGWWQQEISKQKWEEFHAKYPNSELWTKEVLESKGISTRAKI